MFPRKKHRADDHDGWLKAQFQSRSAGAESLLPWTLDTYFTTAAALKEQFTPEELRTVIDAHQGIVIDTAHLRLSHLLIQVTELCDTNALHAKHGSDAARLMEKFRQLNDVQAAVLILWASAFWHGQNCSPESMEKYIAVR